MNDREKGAIQRAGGMPSESPRKVFVKKTPRHEIDLALGRAMEVDQ
jgi:hypothetical protein